MYTIASMLVWIKCVAGIASTEIAADSIVAVLDASTIIITTLVGV